MNVRVLVAALGLVGALAAQSSTTWQIDGGRATAKVRPAVGGAATKLLPRKLHELSITPAVVDFGWDAAGKPESLEIAAAPGDAVTIGVVAAASAETQELALSPAGELRAADGAVWAVRLGPLLHDPVVAVDGGPAAIDEEPVVRGDYRVTVRVDLGEGDAMSAGALGIVARHREGGGCYVFVLDPAAAAARIERWFGADRLVIATAQATSGWRGVHQLSFQLQGFRLQAFVDETLVMQALDGGLQRGAVGLAVSAGGGVVPDDAVAVRVAAPAAPRASAASVCGEGQATVHVATAGQPGNLHVLELRLDRPHAALPLDDAGLELWLLETPAAPQVMLADWRGSLGDNGIGELAIGGRVTVQLRWPDLAALRHQVAMARVLLVTPNGERIAGVAPAVPIRF